MSDDSPTITQQYSFSVGEDGEADGIEPSEESVETSLETWGADVDHRERDTRIDQPEATSFGVDDRKTVTRGDGGEQQALFADTDDDQQTLTGERAASQCLFENDDADDHDDRDDEPADTANTETSPQAVATDGGRTEDDDTDEQDADDRDDEAPESSDENEDTTFDPDAETVTDAWEGAFISTNWGYGQTNVELAQITEVSESGKTVLARLVATERVGHGRTSKQLRPTAEQYGDTFRLHVRSGGDGPTRRGWFSPFDNAPENSIRATRTGFRH